MSVNKKMHPRNIFKTPPSFSELGQKYLEFNKYLKIGLDGKLSINFNDVEALRALSKVLLLHYFGIDIEIPKDTLVPTIPLRLNYILWLQDLVNFVQIPDENVTLIDVGSGATCVFGLLATKLRKWKVLALESNNESLLVARRNVETNSMSNYIEVKNNTNEDNNILIGSLQSTENYTFTMCNPPFFKEKDLFYGKTDRIKAHPPKNAFTGTVNELTYPGGEVAFVEKLIAESQILRGRVMIYTTMIGCKKNLKNLIKKLKSTDVQSFIRTEFCQGNTTRWALGWTFQNINLQEFNHITRGNNKNEKRTKSQSLSSCFKNISCLRDFIPQLEKVLKEMKMIYEIIYSNDNLTEIKVRAIENTWSNARKKRRELARKETILKKNIETTLEMINHYIKTDYIEQIKSRLNTYKLKFEESIPEFHNNITELKSIVNTINESQFNIMKNITDIHIRLSEIEIKDQSFVNQFLHYENLFKEKQTNIKLSLDDILQSINSVFDKNDSDMTISFLQILPSTSNKRTYEEDNAVIESNNKKIKIEESNEHTANCTSSNSNGFIVEFEILLNKISDPEEAIKITMCTIKNSDNPNVLCEIYNYMTNKLKK